MFFFSQKKKTRRETPGAAGVAGDLEKEAGVRDDQEKEDEKEEQQQQRSDGPRHAGGGGGLASLLAVEDGIVYKPEAEEHTRWYRRLLDAGVEENGIKPVPVEKRTNVQYNNLFTVFFTGLLCILPCVNYSKPLPTPPPFPPPRIGI